MEVEKISILDRLLNRASHGDDSSMSSINMFNLAETPKVVKYAIEFIERVDPQHFASLKLAIGAKDKAPQAPNDNKPAIEVVNI